MRECNIYLSGAITGIPDKEAYEWREKIEDVFYELDLPNVHIFNPVKHFTNFQLEMGLITDEELMKFEIDKLRNSDIVLYNCHHPKSLGSMAELSIAYDRNIPILAFNENREELHPWIKHMCTKIFDNQTMMIVFLVEHFIND